MALGARRIGVTSIPPLFTWVFADSKDTGRRLTKKLKPASVNQAAILFNCRLSSQMVNLNKNLPATKLVYIDIYNHLLGLILHFAQNDNRHHHYLFFSFFNFIL